MAHRHCDKHRGKLIKKKKACYDFLMTKNIQRIVIFTLGVSLLFSALAGAGGAYFVLKYFDKLEPREKIIEKATVIEKEYVPQTSHEEKVIKVVEEASQGAVSVIASRDVPVFEQFNRSPFEGNPFFEYFFPEFKVPERREKRTEKQQVSAGTGFVVSADGLILTNKHVVTDEKAEYTVISKDGTKYPAEVLARDPLQDLAILKAQNINLPALKLGDSDKLQAGQSVIAIGNALGEFQNTVSVGVISGLQRTITASSGFGESEVLEELIQTDTAINRGNSGGPLLNLSGEVIGVNVAMAAGAENIGFAIPINKAKKDIEDVKNGGKITYPFLGVRYILINEELKKENNLSVDYGALVIRGEERTDLAVIPGSPADKAGIVENDIILELNKEKITQENPLAKLIQKYRVGETITLKILHRGEEKKVQVTLGER